MQYVRPLRNAVRGWSSRKGWGAEPGVTLHLPDWMYEALNLLHKKEARPEGEILRGRLKGTLRTGPHYSIEIGELRGEAEEEREIVNG